MATDPNAVQLSPEQRAMVAQLADLSGESWPDALDQALTAYAQHQGELDSANGGEILSMQHVDLDLLDA